MKKTIEIICGALMTIVMLSPVVVITMLCSCDNRPATQNLEFKSKSGHIVQGVSEEEAVDIYVDMKIVTVKDTRGVTHEILVTKYNGNGISTLELNKTYDN